MSHFDYIKYRYWKPFEEFRCQDVDLLSKEWNGIFRAVGGLNGCGFYKDKQPYGYFNFVDGAGFWFNVPGLSDIGEYTYSESSMFGFDYCDICSVVFPDSLTVGRYEICNNVDSIYSSVLSVSVENLDVSFEGSVVRVVVL